MIVTALVLGLLGLGLARSYRTWCDNHTEEIEQWLKKPGFGPPRRWWQR